MNFQEKKYRKPAVAGMFYPSDPDKLQNELETLLSISIPERNIDNIFGLVSPHAGYIYSGRTAAYGFNLLKGKDYKTVIIISPSHREYFPGISIYDGDGFETPLGKVDLDNEMADKLINQSRIIFRGIEGHRQEHAVEVQIPFLQQVLGEFEIIPIVMGDQGKMFVDELSQKISEAANEDTLVIASSDLSHYYSRTEADKMDSLVARGIEQFDIGKLEENFNLSRCEACGAGAILSLMNSASILNKKKTLLLHRSDSADTSGDYSQVVGYLSAVVYS